ncbi:hypothetical protein CFN78_24890 [Amycolatopsis antarctica]|uniref:DUF3375 domain-containing protein n=1 Tax=Amycolatopsis antarctica TaxID=1854586 RepID=A0A263CWW5_9PSEU|nr:DUF3375 domain-containing protein [Amycolatopsis antarctica]OZM70634.1 hypothetical protein CFN78_24890 [Amycolatopsis antarctica]
MDHDAIEGLREHHPAWRLLRAGNATLILSFLGWFFVEGNRGATGAAELAGALDEDLFVLNVDPDQPRYPKAAREYLEDWAASELAFLRRFYPAGIDEVHYEVTPAFEKAYAWVESLRARAFVGTESRLHTVVELLRQIVHGSESDPIARLVELRRQRDEIDAEIAAVEAGDVAVLDETGVRDRYQQFAATARELLSDFREVEDNFRSLDRAARERIAAREGGKGELLEDLMDSRSDITVSDQGRSFQAFYDFLLSNSRQDELTELLRAVSRLDAVEADARVRSIHHDWSAAAERAQRTVRQISEQLRRFLDDQVWLENRRVLDLVREVEATALDVRAAPPSLGLDVDDPGIGIVLPFERPLYEVPSSGQVDSFVESQTIDELDAELLFSQTFVDTARLSGNIRAVVPEGALALLADIVELFPIEQGAAEIVGYLALTEDDIEVEMDDGEQTLLDFVDTTGTPRRACLPKVTVRRR